MVHKIVYCNLNQLNYREIERFCNQLWKKNESAHIGFFKAALMMYG